MQITTARCGQPLNSSYRGEVAFTISLEAGCDPHQNIGAANGRKSARIYAS
jgi:hypothetical protein